MAVPFGDQINFGVSTSYYDKKARMRKIKPGEKVLDLLLYPGYLLMQWQGQYQIGIKITNVDY